MAAARLGFDVVILTPEPDAPASRVAAHTLQAAYDDAGALGELARRCAVVTFEFENVPAKVVAALHELGVPTAPGDLALATAQDRVIEKTFFRDQGIATIDFVAIDTADDIVVGLARLGAPALLKTRREGDDPGGPRALCAGVVDHRRPRPRRNLRRLSLDAEHPQERRPAPVGRPGGRPCPHPRRG
jgi:5-(carboxyamino)imidazole ribonucleotide synthase